METSGGNTDLFTSDNFVSYMKQEDYNTVCLRYKLFSIISWILLVYTSWMNIIDANPTYSLLTLLDSGREIDSEGGSRFFGYYPLDTSIKIIQTFITIIIIFGFINYLLFIIFKIDNDNNLEKAMFDNRAKYHFIPLLLTSIVFSLMENVVMIKNDDNLLLMKILVIIIFIFTFFSLISLLYIYIQTKITNKHLILLVIKKCVYSSLIVLLFHNFFNCIVALKYISMRDNSEISSYEIIDSLNTCAKVILPLFGSFVIIFSILFKDIVAMFVNFLMFLGMMVMKYIVIENWSSVFIIDACFMSFSFFGLFSFCSRNLDKKLLLE